MNPVCRTLARAALKRFGEALKRTLRPLSAVSLVRARTPHTPQGRALERRPLGRWSARARAKRSSEASGMVPSGPERPEMPAGTPRNFDRVCFACPTRPPGRPPFAFGANVGDPARAGRVGVPPGGPLAAGGVSGPPGGGGRGRR